MNIQKTAQKALVLNKTRTHFLALKYLSSRYFPTELVGKYGLPGGQMEFGEDPDAAIIREVQEETGITITPSLPFYIWQWQYEKDGHPKQIVAVGRLCFYKSGEIKEPNNEKEVSLAKAAWLSLKDLNLNILIQSEVPIFKRYFTFQRNNPFVF